METAAMLMAAKFLTGLLIACILFGGARIELGGARFEIGNVPPLMLLIALLVSAAWVLRRPSVRSYAGFLRGILTWMLQNDRKHPWRFAFILLGILGGGLLLADLVRFWRFDTRLFDMVYTHSSVFFPWFEGRLLHCSMSPLQSFLVDHFAPALLIPGTFFQFFRHSESVIVFQTLLLVGGTALLLRFGPLEDRPRLALLAVLMLFTSRAFFRPGIDFREEHVAFFSMCLVILGIHRAMPALFFGGLLVFIASKEHTALIALGILAPVLSSRRLARDGRNVRWASAALVIILGYAAMAYFKWIPALQSPIGAQIGQINQRLPQLGSSIPEIIASPINRPGVFWPWLLSRFTDLSTIRYLVLVLIPYGVFLYRAPVWVLAAGIGIFGNIIPFRGEQRSIHWHYELAFAPLVIMGALEGMRRISRVRYWKWGMLVALALSLRWPAFDLASKWPSRADFNDGRALRMLPCEGVIAASENTLGQLARCPHLRLLKGVDCSDHSALWRRLREDPGPPHIPGESIRDATRLVVDVTRGCEGSLGEWLSASGAVEVWSSPSGRFRALEKLPHFTTARGSQ